MTGWKHGALYDPNSNTTTFRVWAPVAEKVQLVLDEGDRRRHAEMSPVGEGYYQSVTNAGPGTRYMYQVDDEPPRPDPGSRSQPDGVHSASAVVDPVFKWTDHKWSGIPLEEYVIYEMHVGTFTTEGTFESAISELSRLKKLGITAVEVMPIAQFPGDRNWGYDGVYMYAAQHSYGGLTGFQKFVNAAHELGLAVVLDVVYNHFGPEGNYLSCFGPYFIEKYRTPWGSGINFDSAHSDGVRDFFIGNAVFWIQDCHVDALRLDAVHAIIDTSAYPFLQQLTAAVHSLGRARHRRVHVMGENDRNDPKFTISTDLGGLGADTQWSDDFHHALHGVLTGERHGYYKDFGLVSQLAKAFTDGFVYDGCYSPHRQRHHGADSRHQDGIRFIVCSQNHDQVGNRPMGERLRSLLSFERTKLAAALPLCSPYIPLIFMGEESGAESPFLYFVSHGDADLIEAVRQGRKKEFREFFARGEAPDPQSESTFNQSKLVPDQGNRGKAITRLYKDLIQLRKKIIAMKPLNKRHTSAWPNDFNSTLVIKRDSEEESVLILFNLAEQTQQLSVPAPCGDWTTLLDTEDSIYEGYGSQSNGTVECEGELRITLRGSSAIILHQNQNHPCHTKSL